MDFKIKLFAERTSSSVVSISSAWLCHFQFHFACEPALKPFEPDSRAPTYSTRARNKCFAVGSDFGSFLFVNQRAHHHKHITFVPNNNFPHECFEYW
jgi:hypothetical protein